MAEEPLNPVERLLKASGRKRLAAIGRPSGISASIRERLQREVIRVYGEQRLSETPRWGVWKLLVPRLAWAAGFVVVILAVGVIFYRPYQVKRANLLARNELHPQAETVTAIDSEEKPEAAANPAAQTAPATMPAPAPAPGPQTSQKRNGFATKVDLQPRERASQTAKPELADTQSTAIPSTNMKLAAARSAIPEESLHTNRPEIFHYSQASSAARYRRNLNSPTVPRVLQQFRIERQADQIRIIDEDGSTYDGRIAPNPARFAVADAASSSQGASDAVLNVAPSPAASAALPGGWIPSFEIQAEGMNRTLNQHVVVRANMLDSIGGSNQLQLKSAARTVSIPQLTAPTALVTNISIQRIIGTVTLAGTNRLRIDAEMDTGAPQ